MYPLLFIIGLLAGYHIFCRYLENRRLNETRKFYQLEIIKTRLETHEQTLTHISQEIHDNTGQMLSVIKMNINSLATCEQAELNEKVVETKKLIVRVIKDLRDLSKSMNADSVAEKGLCASIEAELSTIQKSGIFKIHMQTDGRIYRLEKQKEVAVFRIFQEIINNIIKHSNANEVVACLNYRPDRLILKVEDNGKGFQVTSTDETNTFSNGLGLRNMYNRAQAIGASLNIKSIKEQGTKVNISIPVA